MARGRRLRHVRRSERGTTLLPALGITTLVLLGTTATLALVTGESDAQRGARLQRQAYFAAEAGLAEGREALSLRAGASTLYNDALGGLPRASDVEDVGTPADVWFDLLRTSSTEPWIPYPLARGEGAAVALSDDELAPSIGLPAQATLRYRVLVRDDGDVDAPGTAQPQNPAFDSNGRLWLVAVGEVSLGAGRPVRVVLQQLVDNQNASADTVSEAYGQKGVTSAKDFLGTGSRDITIGAGTQL